MGQPDWQRYLASFHTEHAGITERLLSKADADPYAWLVESLRANNRAETDPCGIDPMVLDLGCGSAPTRPLLADWAWLGVDLSVVELTLAREAGRRPVAVARADRLPVANGAATAVVAAMSLQVVTPVEETLAEIRRVLRPDGDLLALLPATSVPVSGLFGWARVLAALGVAKLPWPNPHLVRTPATVLTSAGFNIVSDEQRIFRLRLPTIDDLGMLVDSLYLPGLTDHQRTVAVRRLSRWAPRGLTVLLPLRRLHVTIDSSGRC